MTTTKDVDPPTDLGIGPDKTMIMGLWCQPLDLSLEEPSGQVIRILATSDKTDLSSEQTTRITTIIGTMTTEWDHHISRTKMNLGFGEVTKTIRDGLPPQDKIHLSKTSADNPDQIHLDLQCLTVFGNRDPSNNKPYDKKFPTSNNGNQPNIVRFTTTGDEINELSGLCPLNYWSLRVQLLISPKKQDSASIFSTSPPDTLKK